MNKTFRDQFSRLPSLFAHPSLAVLTQPEKLFVILALPFGIIYIFLSAPFQAPDEYAHFYRAYAISTGHFSGIQQSIPESVYEFSITVSKDLPGNDQNKQSKKALVEELFRRFEPQPQVEVSFINTAIVSPLPYLPQAVGILIGRLLQMNPIFIFYLGRLANFLAWFGLTLLAIRTTPIHPRLFVALALMPMTLHQSASNSPDAATIALSFLFIAVILKILFEQGTAIHWSDWGKISVLIIAIALCKSIYLITAGLLVAVPLRHFKKQRIVLPLTLAVIGIGLVTGLIWLQYISQSVSVEAMNNYRTPTMGSIEYILRHPETVAPIFWHSAVVYTGGILRMFIGVLGWVDTPLPNWIYPLYYALLLFIAVFDPHSHIFNVFERLWMAFLVIVAGLLMMAIFFYPNVSVGNGIVDFIQGRYYLPFGPLYFLPFSNRNWSISKNSRIWVVAALLHALVLIVSVRAMVWRYYAI